MNTVHEIDVYVRFSETDAAGHVNNTSYFLYFEEARTRYFQAAGFGQMLEESKVNFILASTNCDYVAQAFAHQTLKVATYVTDIGNKSFTVEHVLKNRHMDIIARSKAVLVCFDYAAQKTVPLPDFLRDILEKEMMKHKV